MGANNSSTNMQAELDQLKEDVRVASEQERWLDQSIADMQNSLRTLAEDEENAQYAYVTHEDVRSIAAFAPDTVIAIKAPSGTTLEVPDPDEGMEFPHRRYQIYLKSQTGPVEVFLVSQADGEEGDDSAAAEAASAAVSDPPSADGSRRGKRGRQAGEPPAPLPTAASSPQAKRVGADACGTASCEGFLKLDPVGESEADHWASAPRSQELGIADLYFGDALNSDVKVEG